MTSKVSIVRCSSYDSALVLEATRKAIDLIGGAPNFIKPQSSVLVKPNLLMAKEPEFGIDTHPEVVRAVIRILKEIGCKVFVGDSPSVWGEQSERVDARRAMGSSTFGDRALNFYTTLSAIDGLPSSIQVMNPYARPEIRRYVKSFLGKFFSDDRDRVFVFGINPGRFGAGVTGVTFTDPVALEQCCGIPNELEKRREVSSEFVYEFIERWGGVEKFYRDFFLTAVSPLGFTRNGTNYNYYDEPKLFTALKPFIVRTLKDQLALGARRDAAILLGKGRNQRVFAELNQAHGFFRRLYTLEHPRFIMQYRRKQLRDYLEKYHEAFARALS